MKGIWIVVQHLQCIFQFERQNAQEESIALREKLDNTWKEVEILLKSSSRSKKGCLAVILSSFLCGYLQLLTFLVDKEDAKDSYKPDTYDLAVKQMQYEKKAVPSERLAIFLNVFIGMKSEQMLFSEVSTIVSSSEFYNELKCIWIRKYVQDECILLMKMFFDLLDFVERFWSSLFCLERLKSWAINVLFIIVHMIL